MLPTAIFLERFLPLFLFSLYLITAVRLCSYRRWRDAGAPNPFLPRMVQAIVARVERKDPSPSAW